MEPHLLFSRDILQKYAVQGSIFDREDHCINKIRQRAPTPLQGEMATELGSEEGSYHDQGHLPVLLVHVQGTEDSMHQHQELVVNMCSQYSKPCCGGIYHNMKWQYESGGWRGQWKGLGYYYAAAEMHSIVYILYCSTIISNSQVSAVPMVELFEPTRLANCVLQLFKSASSQTELFDQEVEMELDSKITSSRKVKQVKVAFRLKRNKHLAVQVWVPDITFLPTSALLSRDIPLIPSGKGKKQIIKNLFN
jgi:hypothetical protein